MEYRQLGTTGIKVSCLCLGTMTWGQQNSESQAHEQLNVAVDHGINFIDTAEMYPVPPQAETQGRTEEYIGSWLRAGGQRDRLILATKVSGPAPWIDYIRPGKVTLDRRNIEAALEASLKRLGTDYVDLYQVHWPARDTNFFGRLGYYHAPEHDDVPIEETLEVMADLVRAGKARHIGISNETPWGISRWLQCAERNNLPRIAAIQNPYNLLNRTFEIGLAEFVQRELVGMLAYSPLAFGVLSGKYLESVAPAGARLTLFGGRYQRYSNERGIEATRHYVALAREHGLEPAAMALAFVRSRPFVTSAIIGATSKDQLRANIDSASLDLSKDLLRQMEKIHTAFPNPCP